MDLATDSSDLHLTLKRLMQEKSERDGVEFTVYKLSKALQMPHSILVRLMHADPSKRVNNPRIDTLTKIVDYFKTDGFNITIDDLLLSSKTIEVQSQATGLFTVEKTIPVYSFATENQKKLGTVNIKLTSNIKNAIALLSEHDIKPLFKKGSMFIIDPTLPPRR